MSPRLSRQGPAWGRVGMHGARRGRGHSGAGAHAGVTSGQLE